jgi:NAD(P)-dependent dehydrogenase (short-subunit alcohol dehydrogenase family)
VQSLGEPALGRDEGGIALHPIRQGFEGRVLGRKDRRGVRAGVHFATEDGGDEVSAPWEVTVDSADAGPLRDLPHGSVHPEAANTVLAASSNASMLRRASALPLLREAPAGRIVNVSTGVGSLTRNSDPAYPYRSIFGPVYPASKTALNAMTLAMAIELESTNIKVNAARPGFTSTIMRARRASRRTPASRCVGPDGPDRHVLERSRTAPVVT